MNEGTLDPNIIWFRILYENTKEKDTLIKNILKNLSKEFVKIFVKNIRA